MPVNLEKMLQKIVEIQNSTNEAIVMLEDILTSPDLPDDYNYHFNLIQENLLQLEKQFDAAIILIERLQGKR